VGCRFWQGAATEVFATSPSDHDLCAIGTFTHNLETTRSARCRPSRRFEGLHRSGLRSGARHCLDPGGRVAVVPCDLRAAGDDTARPDVVLLFGKAGQMLILSEASQQVEGGLPPDMGPPACAIVLQAKNTGRAALSLAAGARAHIWAMWRSGRFLAPNWIFTRNVSQCSRKRTPP
jgi:hypothetical protein